MPGCAGNFACSQLIYSALQGNARGMAPSKPLPWGNDAPLLCPLPTTLWGAQNASQQKGRTPSLASLWDWLCEGCSPGRDLPHQATALTCTFPAQLCMVKQRLNPIMWPLRSLPVNWAASHMLLSPFTANTRPYPLKKASCECDLLLF